MQGLHLTADLHQCRCDVAWLTNAASLGEHCLAAAQAAGLQTVGSLFHALPPKDKDAAGMTGVTATILLAESHLCIHTWPKQSAVTLDVYVCNFGGDHSGKAHALMDSLVTLFNAKRIRRHSLSRGEIS